jgi:hypothetical protein
MLSLVARRDSSIKSPRSWALDRENGRKSPGRFPLVVMRDALRLKNGDDLMRAGVDDEDLVRD